MRAGRWILVLALFAMPRTVHAQTTIFPEWLGRDDDAWRGAREPQIEGVTRLYRDAAPIEAGSLEGAVLLCRVEAFEPEGDRWDTFADPDLRIVASVGARRSVIWGTENSRAHVFSIPGVTLRRGQRVTFAVADRDMTFDEPIGRLEARYEGRLPLAMRARHLEGECRAAPASIVARRLDDALRQASVHVAAIEGATPDLALVDLGRPTSARVDARRHLSIAAAWGGWPEPRVHAARTALEASERGFDARARRAIAEAHRAAPRVGDPVTIERGGAVRVHAFACGPRARALAPGDDAARCVAQLDVSSPTDGVPPWLGSVDVVDARGELYAASASAFVERVDETTVRVAIVLPDRITARGALVRVGDRRAFLRLA